MAFRGFVFDFDGLLLDTEAVHYEAWQEKFAEFGCTMTFDDWWKIIGTHSGAYDPAQDLFTRTNGSIDPATVRKSVQQRTEERLVQLSLRPGVEDFIHQARSLGIRMAVATSSSRNWVMPFLDRFALTPFFEAVLTSNDVVNVKPDPELYRKAVEKLSLQPESVMAFEDSLNGVKAARAAGLYCVAIPNMVTRKMDFSIANQVAESFTQLSVSELCRIDPL